MKIHPKLLQSRNDFVAMLMMLYSPEGIQAFTEMAAEDFRVEWGDLTPQEAHYVLFLVNLSEQVKSIAHHTDVLTLMPPIVDKALSNIVTKLAIYKPVLEGIASGKLSPLEAKIGAGEIDFSHGKGVVMSIGELNNLLINAA